MPDATFALERLDVEDARLVVRGRWTGVRGLRFVRPTLVVGDRALLATLDHKPWAPDTPDWTAAFPWDAPTPPDLRELTLTVAPSVSVPLAPEPVDTEEAPGAEGGAPHGTRAERDVPRAERDTLRAERDTSRAERDTSRAERDALRAERDALAADLHAERERLAATRADLRAAREQLHAAEQAARPERIAAAVAPVEAQRDRALAQLEEAVRDREAAVRTRERMARERDVALGRVAEAQAARDAARAQRDEIALALDALGGRPPASPPASASEAGPPAGDASDQVPADPAAPIGVREVPAARRVAGELHRAARAPRAVSALDVWLVRVLGGTAAVCFVVLLVLLLVVFAGA